MDCGANDFEMSKLEEFLDENNIFYHARDNSVTLICPQCNKQKLDIHKIEHNFICYHCAETTNPIKGGNCTKLLSEISGLEYGIVKRKLGGFVSMSDFRNNSLTASPKPIETTKIEEIKFPEFAYRLTAASSKPGIDYLQQKRGIPLDIATKYEIRYDYKNQNIVFPVYDGTVLVGYQARSIDPSAFLQKMTMKGFKKADYLMFEQSVTDERVILAEGPVTALKFARTGVGFVASMGKYVSEVQMSRLKARGVKTIYLALDDDAFVETKKLMNKYSSDFDFFLLQLSPEIRKELKHVKKPDFGDCTFDQIDLIVQQAIPFNRNTLI